MGMKTSVEKTRNARLRRLSGWILLGWCACVLLPSFKSVRAYLALPLYVHDAEARAENAYVMADGFAYQERLRAAADLYHMGRIQKIFIMREQYPAGYNFELGRLQTVTEQAFDFLELLNVPTSVVHPLEVEQQVWLSSYAEALAMRDALPPSPPSVMVITSAPHTRRSRLCFQRAWGEATRIYVYSASGTRESAEVYEPLTHEYLKLGVYWLFARGAENVRNNRAHAAKESPNICRIFLKRLELSSSSFA